MSVHHKDDSPQNAERRRFLEIAKKAGFTAAVVAGASGALLTSTHAQAAVNEERERQKRAKYTMTIATAYIIGASRSYPIMQLDFKENIQNMTRGQVYVKLAPGGQLGAGGALAQKVQAGTIQAAQHSLSNFAPFAPAVDLINIPYWCGENQKFINLVTSKAWEEEIHPRVAAKGFKPLWYVVIDPRVVAVRKGLDGPIKTPDQLEGVKFRVPGSKILQQMYRLLGANPTPVAWGETPSAIKQGVADALDPSVEALNVFGFKDVLSSVTFNRAVPDSQVFSCNLEWFNSLPKDIQEGIEFASEVTSIQNLAKVPAARAYAMAELGDAGVEFYAPNSDEMRQWVEKAGHQRPEWDEFKLQLAGSKDTFNKLLDAANGNSRFYVHDV
ncbi:C4-dicarboxylate ABC transporter [Enterovibrio norvegicus]|uniref:TRAP transporter substrate-binding protein n=1 Tax=Enterovibrio norvegicus TaxID=188144 RepID=A0ABV4L806_9GAMM|nr:TRAP transporter substrate-binding protein [Enterovibrio norvegicus]MCC4798075.1 TRAP transporter substrate-binding protein [Enterovibrio norvegicus]OEE63720.1 C4-dicarboxylate ABC transporter [Enterovibrio norvegicus]OEF55850.1 C4-dicarboxylate ABC transporter [Enterovibrio norvegicus]PMH72079.1 C4-dicarboxylate ABC transporter [Enterovibrio norvegicus]PMI32346.1 C4-dicarboxylate ABC transporter [Enterovibrio norvegicus]